MIRILFVDDEPAVLEGLENRLHRLRRDWHMRFATGGPEALHELARSPYDVIVSDMRMPGMDGAQLLEEVRERYPHMARFILSGQTGEDGIVRLMPVAHQLLTKPCDAGALERSVQRICTLSRKLMRPAVQQVLGSLNSLPALPKLYWDLVNELQNPQAHAATVAGIIEQDVAMTARLLQMANSVFFGQGRAISNVKDAVALLGFEPIRSIVLSLQLVHAMGGMSEDSAFSLGHLQTHSLQVAQLASSMLRQPEERHTAFSAGMLHEIGSLVLASSLPAEWNEVRRRVREQVQTPLQAETALFGCDHADIGAQLLNRWGLPVALVEAVAFHHHTGQSGEQRFGVVGAVHVANLLLLERSGRVGLPEDYDEDWLREVGMLPTVTAWRQGEPVQAAQAA